MLASVAYLNHRSYLFTPQPHHRLGAGPTVQIHKSYSDYSTSSLRIILQGFLFSVTQALPPLTPNRRTVDASFLRSTNTMPGGRKRPKPVILNKDLRDDSMSLVHREKTVDELTVS